MRAEDDAGTTRQIIGVIVSVCMFVGAVGTVRTYQEHSSNSFLQKSGVNTSGKIIEKFQDARTSDREMVRYFFRYGFDNRSTTDKCELTGPRLTTPKEKACTYTIRIQKIADIHYQKVRVGDEVDVLYFSDGERTESIVVGFDDIGIELKIKFIFFGLLIFGPISLLVRSYRRSF